jgi:IclR family transcriptional regulator, KDG regulon repressor
MTVQSIHRATQILQLFSFREERLGISEMSRRLALPKGTVQGLVRSLTEVGLLARDQDSRQYRLGLELHQLGAVAAATHELTRKGAGAANHLADRTGLLCRLGVWQAESPIVIFTAFPRANVPHAHQFGPRVPAYCTALGKALLAFVDPETRRHYLDNTELVSYTPNTIIDPGRLEEDLAGTRARGYAVNREEIVPGRSALGCPLYRAGGVLAGAVALSGELDRVTGSETERLILALRETSADISGYLGHIPGAGGCSQPPRGKEET